MPYARQWKCQVHENSNVLLATSKLNEPILITTQFDLNFRLQSNLMSSHYDETISWLNAHRIFQQEEPTLVSIEAIESYKYVDITTSFGTLPISQWERYTTVNTEKEDFYKTISRSSKRRKILKRLDTVAQREDNWDGYDSKKPTELTIDRATHFIQELLDNDVISARFLQLEPFICSDEDGYITVECYKGKRSLCFDIQEDETMYTKIEKTSANTMTQTASLNQDNYLPLWEWFFDE